MVEFEEVYTRFRSPVWRLARRLTRNHEEALDASQEIFLRIWKGLPGYRGDAKLSTWVFQIAWNHLRLLHRKNVRRQEALGLEVVSGDEVVERFEDQRPSPERKAGARQLVERVEGALGRLPEHYRVVLWLRDGEDLTYDEIAATLDIPIGTVRSRLARARSAMKRLVEEG
ncbi:MAG: sigma-70 family RNA polymerase sigma factor [bacterium]|nr:sigma-70 family RNA polymerase sigma factor [bacterium]